VNYSELLGERGEQSVPRREDPTRASVDVASIALGGFDAAIVWDLSRYRLSESDAGANRADSQMRCEKSPGTYPFFPAAPECGPIALSSSARIQG
jgi:hypothetical protein